MQALSVFKAAKLFIHFVDHRHGEKVVALAKKAGARGGTIAQGRAMADNRLLQALSLADVHQEIIFIVMGPETETVLGALSEAAAREPKKYGGLGLLLDVSGMLFRVPAQNQAQESQPQEGDKNMEAEFKLITIIVNHGHADDVMAAARKAGAKGGTILNARGTGTEEDVKFFGISLVPEKEMLLIVSEAQSAPAIVEAVNNLPYIRQPGGGVIYYMDIEKFMLLGKPLP